MTIELSDRLIAVDVRTETPALTVDASLIVGVVVDSGDCAAS